MVTLGGKARNAAEKDLATKLVSDVHGVKRVVNNMTIAGTEPKATNPASGVVSVADAACLQGKFHIELQPPQGVSGPGHFQNRSMLESCFA